MAHPETPVQRTMVRCNPSPECDGIAAIHDPRQPMETDMCEQRQPTKGKIDTLIQALDRLSDRMDALVKAAEDQREGAGRKE